MASVLNWCFSDSLCSNVTCIHNIAKTPGTIVTVTDLTECPRCGGSHPDLEMRPFTRPIETAEERAEWFGTCPELGEPIVVLLARNFDAYSRTIEAAVKRRDITEEEGALALRYAEELRQQRAAAGG